MARPDICTARIQLGSISIEAVDSLVGREAIGEPFRYEMQANVRGSFPPPSALLGQIATLTLEDAYGERTIVGIASEVETRTTDFGEGVIRIVLVPRTHAATLGRASRSWQDKSAIDAVESVLAPTSTVVRALSRTYPPVPYRVEREEDDWTFATRTLAAEGVTFYYDHDEGSAIVLADDTRAAPDLTGLSVFPYHPDGMNVSSEAIVLLSRFSAASTTKVARRSFSWQNPALALGSSTGAGRYESYDCAGGGPADPAVVERVAKDTEAAIRAGSSGIAGEAATARLYPGRAFSIVPVSAHALDEPWFAEPWLVTSIEIDLSGRHHSFTTRFTAIAKSIPYRPAPRADVRALRGDEIGGATTPWSGGQPGISWGMVVAGGGDEVFPDAHGRTRIQAHWDRGGSKDQGAGTWMRVAQRFTESSMMFPRTGWFVATMNEEGSADAPHTMMRIHDGERPPEYSLPENKTRVVFKSATTPGGGSHNEMHFEDAKGREVVFWNASKDMNVLVKNDASERVDNDAWHDVGVDQTVTSGVSYSEQVRANQTVTIGANQKIALGEDRSKTVGANDTVTVGGSRKLKVGEASSLGVAKNRSLKVGAVLIDVSLGDIGATSRIANTTVGGAIVRLSAKNFTEDASVASAELVGAVKVETAGENRTIGIDKHMVEAVGGMVSIDAGKRYVDTATKKSKWSVLGPITANTKEITIEGYKSIELRCGASSLVIEPDQIRIDGKTLQLDGAELEALTGVIVHNG